MDDSIIKLSAIKGYNFDIKTTAILKMDTRREATLQRQIEKVKRDLAALGDLRPGSLSTQFNVCGSPGCRCKATPPIKHGPYYQVSYTRKGKSSSKFVKHDERLANGFVVHTVTHWRILLDSGSCAQDPGRMLAVVSRE